MKYFIRALENYATFSGRASRKEYWMFILFYAIFAFAIGLVLGILGLDEDSINAISSVYYLAFLLPNLAVGVRRMHDVGKSGWFLLIPIYNLILAVTEGDTGANEYGPEPNNDAVA